MPATPMPAAIESDASLSCLTGSPVYLCFVSNTADLPASVRESLATALHEARDAVRSGDVETAHDRLNTVSRILRAKVPPGLTHDRLVHGVAAVERTAADEPLVASEYLRAMKSIVETAEQSS